MPVVVGGVIVVVDKIPPGDKPGSVEVRQVLPHSRIHHRHRDAVSSGQVPGSFHVDAFQVPLVPVICIVGDSERVGIGILFGEFNGTVLPELREHRLRIGMAKQCILPSLAALADFFEPERFPEVCFPGLCHTFLELDQDLVRHQDGFVINNIYLDVIGREDLGTGNVSRSGKDQDARADQYQPHF